MKKLILAAMALLPLVALAQDGAYTVQGKVGSYNAPAKMYLQYQVKDKLVTDSVILKAGQFQFKGSTGSSPNNAYLVLNAEKEMAQFIKITSQFILKQALSM